jgi:hypothetical protein
MLSEADLQELRGIAFDRLLLQVWPRGRGDGHRSHKQYDDMLLAKRIGVHVNTMRDWRSGVTVPVPRTLLRVMSGLEAEFGVPSEMWAQALAISNYARGYVAPSSGARFIPLRSCARIYEDGDIRRQYGYQEVLHPVRRDSKAQLIVEVKCLLCQSVREVPLFSLRSDSVSSCKPCATRLRRCKSRSGFRGVWHDPHSNSRPWIVDEKSTGIPGSRSFRHLVAAAHYYDVCMFERYGHTLFLNFPDEYDQSNDPVFVPVQRASAGSPP